MNVTAIFDHEYMGEAAGAVWIVYSPANKKWFQRQPLLDASSALFLAEKYSTKAVAFRHLLLGICDHYPDWTEITVIGLVVSEAFGPELDHGERIEVLEDGFRLHRD